MLAWAIISRWPDGAWTWICWPGVVPGGTVMARVSELSRDRESVGQGKSVDIDGSRTSNNKKEPTSLQTTLNQMAPFRITFLDCSLKTIVDLCSLLLLHPPLPLLPPPLPTCPHVTTRPFPNTTAKA